MKKFSKVLAFETSCDDTSVAIVEHDGFVDQVVSANQDLQHKKFGGVVPEIASRNHTLNILPLMDECMQRASLGWDDIDGIVVTSRPGLIGALLVGLITAKTLAMTKNKPFIGVNHLEAHLLAPFLKDSEYCPPENFDYPYLALAVSGGHTHLYVVEGLGQYRVLGKTLDDAAGEAFDKFGKMLGLGFPGGVKVDKLSKEGDPKAYHFPRALIRDETFNFSFSGVKASALRQLEKMEKNEIEKNKSDLCASYQEAIVEALLAKLDRAAVKTGLKRAVLTGGVSANSRLRAKGLEWASDKGVQMVIPPLRYCTDNAAMVGLAGIHRLNSGQQSAQDLSPSPQSWPEDFILS